ncbi:AsmA family protein [Microvirga pudoricolor]|uniref:AsmA family protein n=1 Tax=Microvirga pudoricolor TaxID=2778729 RepID=UPI001950AE8B|nr:AsmA-like C-terminal region-containing protein [Microvirga pudoricolor]MBM6594291.1 AsmA family protein [Microvirga pudoricolor]
MSRRVVLLLALAALAVLGTAAVPWTLTSGRLTASIARNLMDNYGVAMNVAGRSTIAFLPVPRVKFEDVSLASAGREVTTEGGTLRAELRLWPLLVGRIELSEASLTDTRVQVAPERARAFDWVKALAARQDKPQDVPRLVLAASSIRWADGRDGQVEDVNAVMNWPDTSDTLDVVGSATWRRESVRISQFSIQPSMLASDRPSPFVISASLPSGRVALSGEAQLGEDIRVTGQSTIHAASIRDFSRWSGLDVPLGPMMQALSVSGEFSLTRRRLSWPSVVVTLGSDRLEGTLSVRLEGEQPVIAGTLAAETLDLSGFFEPFAEARTYAGTWNESAISLAQSTRGNLDLRLSATSARLGALKLSDMAANVLVRPGQIEASLGRASFHDGSLKGRLILAQAGTGTDVRTQASFTGIDLGAFLSSIGEPRWITGRAQGQIQLEGSGETVAQIVRQSQGRTSLTVKEGELIGIGLNDVLRRIEKRPLAASLDWQGGRTAFDTAQVGLTINAGVGDITEGRLTSPQVITTLKGRVLLAERSLDLKAMVDPAAPATAISPMIMFDVDGGWDSVRITPDAKSLIQRSGAAKPLFGPVQAAKPTNPVANAQ